MSDGPAPPDPTRRVDPVDPGATRRIDPDDPGVTRRVDPSGSADPTQAIPATGLGDDDGYTVVPNRPPGEGRPVDEELIVDDREPERSRGRDWAIGLGGVAAGILLAIIVAFAAGGDEPVDDQVAAAQEQVAELEAERDALQAENEALEARASDAEAAVGAGDADLDAQRQALDQREAQLDERDGSLNQRESGLDDRERQLDEREASIDQGGPGDGSGDGSGDGGIDLPDIDADEVEGFIDRIMDRIRSLF